MRRDLSQGHTLKNAQLNVWSFSELFMGLIPKFHTKVNIFFFRTTTIYSLSL